VVEFEQEIVTVEGLVPFPAIYFQQVGDWNISIDDFLCYGSMRLAQITPITALQVNGRLVIGSTGCVSGVVVGAATLR